MIVPCFILSSCADFVHAPTLSRQLRKHGLLANVLCHQQPCVFAIHDLSLSTYLPSSVPLLNCPNFPPSAARVSLSTSPSPSPTKSGIPYFFRVSASNAIGEGDAMVTTPAYLVPMTAPDMLDFGTGVTLSILPSGDAVSVTDSSTSLHVSFSPPPNDNGDAVDE